MSKFVAICVLCLVVFSCIRESFTQELQLYMGSGVQDLKAIPDTIQRMFGVIDQQMDTKFQKKFIEDNGKIHNPRIVAEYLSEEVLKHAKNNKFFPNKPEIQPVIQAAVNVYVAAFRANPSHPYYDYSAMPGYNNFTRLLSDLRNAVPPRTHGCGSPDGTCACAKMSPIPGV